MTFINSCRGMALEMVQRSEHEVNAKMMELVEDPFEFVVEIDRLAADYRRLGDRSVTNL